jgi:[ribosomal protein S5]-alanine N-acetyltransferase
MMALPDLTGSRVRITPFTAGDITERYLGWLNDPEVVRFSNQRFVAHTADSARAYLKSFDGTANAFLLVRRLSDDQPIGTLTVYVNARHGTADVGVMIGEREVWGGGFGQDAWDQVLSWLLADGGIRKVTAGALACNRGMVRLMERSGMMLEGVRKDQEIVDGRPEDIVLYARFTQP